MRAAADLSSGPALTLPAPSALRPSPARSTNSTLVRITEPLLPDCIDANSNVHSNRGRDVRPKHVVVHACLTCSTHSFVVTKCVRMCSPLRIVRTVMTAALLLPLIGCGGGGGGDESP